MVRQVKRRVIAGELVGEKTHFTCRSESARVMADFDRIERLHLSEVDM
jgi:hypothetical protein